MRGVGNSLCELLQTGVLCIIDHKSQDNRQRKGGDQRIQAERHRIAQQFPEHNGFEKFLKMFESHPWTLHHSRVRQKILKCDLDSIHGPIGKNQDVEKGGQDEQIQEVIPFHQHPGPLSTGSSFGRTLRRCLQGCGCLFLTFFKQLSQFFRSPFYFFSIFITTFFENDVNKQYFYYKHFLKKAVFP